MPYEKSKTLSADLVAYRQTPKFEKSLNDARAEQLSAAQKPEHKATFEAVCKGAAQ